MATKTGKSALLLGGTGAVGKKLLAELLASDEWTRVGEYGRRVTAPSADADAAPSKLEQKTIDFEALDGAGLKDGRWDVVFVTLGTTRAQAGSAAQFEKIDRECVSAAVGGWTDGC
jgi:oxidoreductase